MMTKQERMKLHDDMRRGSQMLVERIECSVKDQEKFSWQELMNMADIIKDLSEAEKNLAKACHYAKDMPEL